MARWFTDAVVTLQNPSWMEEAMGSSAWNQLCDGLDQLYEDVEPVMPLTAAVRKHGLPEQILVPFVRQLALEMLLPARRRAVVEILPGLILGLANGRAPPELGFPEATGSSASNSSGAKGGAEEAQRRRAIMAADLFLGVGQETGNTDFAYLGIQLLRANDIPVPFPKQKQLTNVFSAATRIQTDWQMRVSGQLVEVLPKWMDYYKTVYNDNIQAMKRLNEKEGSAMAKASQKADAVKREKMPHGGIHLRNENDRAGSSYRGEENVDGVHDYFSSHRDENMDRLADLEKRIEECVRKRDVDWRLGNEHLYSRFKRKKSPLTENPSKATESTGKAAVDGDGDRDDTDEEIL
uniref:Uncharacterized protein TCIL3000_5_4310 n=1 Tax=Trypanosoma congolense (strain IL3000) TaxID=1068625 RepID=G0UM22_TRYCI|nr:unnamed protein product [Trypanosoma congolense IL3000]